MPSAMLIEASIVPLLPEVLDHCQKAIDVSPQLWYKKASRTGDTLWTHSKYALNCKKFSTTPATISTIWRPSCSNYTTTSKAISIHCPTAARIPKLVKRRAFNPSSAASGLSAPPVLDIVSAAEPAPLASGHFG